MIGRACPPRFAVCEGRHLFASFVASFAPYHIQIGEEESVTPSGNHRMDAGVNTHRLPRQHRSFAHTTTCTIITKTYIYSPWDPRTRTTLTLGSPTLACHDIEPSIGELALVLVEPGNIVRIWRERCVSNVNIIVRMMLKTRGPFHVHARISTTFHLQSTLKKTIAFLRPTRVPQEAANCGIHFYHPTGKGNPNFNEYNTHARSPQEASEEIPRSGGGDQPNHRPFMGGRDKTPTRESWQWRQRGHLHRSIGTQLPKGYGGGGRGEKGKQRQRSNPDASGGYLYIGRVQVLGKSEWSEIVPAPSDMVGPPGLGGIHSSPRDNFLIGGTCGFRLVRNARNY
ncbi:hypothetical protein BHE74_00047694 [Ensete ventricosum]|nr:hypothetical protein BHE74_00047694 [Ensete ventricosum]